MFQACCTCLSLFGEGFPCASVCLNVDDGGISSDEILNITLESLNHT